MASPAKARHIAVSGITKKPAKQIVSANGQKTSVSVKKAIIRTARPPKENALSANKYAWY